MSASTEQRSPAEPSEQQEPEQLRTICCVCRVQIHDGYLDQGRASHGLHPGDCTTVLMAGVDEPARTLLLEALQAAAPILQREGRYAHLLAPGQSMLVHGIPALADRLDQVRTAARALLEVVDRRLFLLDTRESVAGDELRQAVAK